MSRELSSCHPYFNTCTITSIAVDVVNLVILNDEIKQFLLLETGTLCPVLSYMAVVASKKIANIGILCLQNFFWVYFCPEVFQRLLILVDHLERPG